MPKDTEGKKYLSIAIPYKNTLLLQALTQEHEQTNIPESQLMVQFATEYIKLLKGQSHLVLVSTQAPPNLQGMAQLNQVNPLLSGRESLKHIGQEEIIRADLDVYGPPDG